MSDLPPHEPRPAELDDAAARLAGGIGMVVGAGLHLAVGLFYAASGLLAPGWAVLALGAVWVALAVVLWRNRRRPTVTLAVPFVAAAVWFVTMRAGEALLGWTA